MIVNAGTGVVVEESEAGEGSRLTAQEAAEVVGLAEQSRNSHRAYPKGKHPNFIEAARVHKFKPGQSGNPSGKKPKPINLIAMLRDELARIPTIEEDKFDGEGHTNAWWMVKNIMGQARDGDRNVARDLLDRLEGKPIATLAGPGGGPIEVKQETTVIAKSDLRPALEALVSCGAVTVSMN